MLILARIVLARIILRICPPLHFSRLPSIRWQLRVMSGTLKPTAANANSSELLAALMTARPALRADDMQQCMLQLGNLLDGMTGNSIALVNYKDMLGHFEACGLNQLDLAAFESLLSDGQLFFRGYGSSVAAPKQKGEKSSKGGARTLSHPKLRVRRTTQEYLLSYHHPAHLYNPQVASSAAGGERTIARLLMKECKQVSRDNYPTDDEAAVVCDDRRLMLIGYPKPRDWGGRPRSWLVRRPPRAPAPALAALAAFAVPPTLFCGMQLTRAPALAASRQELLLHRDE